VGYRSSSGAESSIGTALLALSDRIADSFCGGSGGEKKGLTAANQPRDLVPTMLLAVAVGVPHPPFTKFLILNGLFQNIDNKGVKGL
jgi:hypothetical protein